MPQTLDHRCGGSAEAVTRSRKEALAQNIRAFVGAGCEGETVGGQRHLPKENRRQFNHGTWRVCGRGQRNGRIGTCVVAEYPAWPQRLTRPKSYDSRTALFVKPRAGMKDIL